MRLLRIVPDNHCQSHCMATGKTAITVYESGARVCSMPRVMMLKSFPSPPNADAQSLA